MPAQELPELRPVRDFPNCALAALMPLIAKPFSSCFWMKDQHGHKSHGAHDEQDREKDQGDNAMYEVSHGGNPITVLRFMNKWNKERVCNKNS